MPTSDYAFGYIFRQQHADLLDEADHRRLARELRTPGRRPVVAWRQRLADALRLPARPVTPRPRPARLQSAGS